MTVANTGAMVNTLAEAAKQVAGGKFSGCLVLLLAADGNVVTYSEMTGTPPGVIVGILELVKTKLTLEALGIKPRAVPMPPAEEPAPES